MRKHTFSKRLSGAAVAFAFGTSMAQAALIAPGVGHEVVDAAIPVVDTKAGIGAGGIAGADVSVGGSAVSIGAGVQDKGAKVGAGVSAGSQGGQVGATAGANAAAGSDVSVDADVGASAGVGDGKVDAAGNVATDAKAGSTEVGAGTQAGASAGAGDVEGSANVEADTGTGHVNAGAGVSAGPGAGGVQVDAGAGMSSDTETANHLRSNTDAPGQVGSDAPTDAASPAPAVVQAGSVILLPLPPLAARQGGGADSKNVRETQLATINCVDGLADDCYSASAAELKPIPPSGIRFELADATDGAAKVELPVTVRPTHGVGPADAGAIESFAASLEDPVRMNNVLVVRCIIVNTGTRSRVVPPLDVRLMNDAGEIVGRSVLSAPGEALAGRKEKTFKLRIYPLPPNATRLAVAFVSAT